MSCERTCLSECKVTLNSIFTLNENHAEEEIPDEDCYDDELKKDLDEEDLEICEKSESDPIKQSEKVTW